MPTALLLAVSLVVAVPPSLFAEPSALFDGARTFAAADAVVAPSAGPRPASSAATAPRRAILTLQPSLAVFDIPSAPPTAPIPDLLRATSGDSSISVLFDEEAFEKASLDTIRSAGRTLDLEMFGFNNETLIAALMTQAGRGVKIRVVLDPFIGLNPWEWKHKSKVASKLRAAGIDVAFYPTRILSGAPFKIDHVKLLVADGVRAVAGGSNWDRELRGTHDYNLKLDGPVVRGLAEAFEESWAVSHGLPAPPRGPSDPEASLRVLVTGPGRREPLEAILDQINKAKVSIRTEQLLLDQNEVVKALIEAHKRGVDVRVILDPNKFFFGGVNRRTADRLVAAGVPVRFFRDPSGDLDFLHAKMAVFDGEISILGSANWSRNALEVNHELAFLMKDLAVAAPLADAFDLDWEGRSSAPGRSGALKRAWHRFIAALAGPFS